MRPAVIRSVLLALAIVAIIGGTVLGIAITQHRAAPAPDPVNTDPALAHIARSAIADDTAAQTTNENTPKSDTATKTAMRNRRNDDTRIACHAIAQMPTLPADIDDFFHRSCVIGGADLVPNPTIAAGPA